MPENDILLTPKDRRNKVRELITQRKSQSEMAEILNVSLPTIKKDFKKIKQEASKEIMSKTQADWIEQIITEYDKIYNEAWNLYLQDKSPGTLRLLKDIESDTMNALGKLGVVMTKAPDQNIKQLNAVKVIYETINSTGTPELVPEIKRKNQDSSSG